MGQDHLFLEFEKNLSNQFRGLEFDPKHHTFEIPSRVSIMKYMINIIYFIIKKTKTRTIINLLRETRNRKTFYHIGHADNMLILMTNTLITVHV